MSVDVEPEARAARGRSSAAAEGRPLRVLTFMDWYLPGHRAGGPIPAVANLVEALAPEVRFAIVTRDRDLGMDAPYADVPRDAWQRIGAARVLYASPGGLGMGALRRRVHAEPHDVVYLNSFFSRFSMRVLTLRGMRRIPRAGLVIAPRGEFAPSALETRGGRKRTWIATARRLGLCRGAVWQASSAHEAEEIRGVWGADAPVFLTSELPSALHAPARTPKEAGRARLVFVARICRVKNLDGVIRALAGVRAPVSIDLYGPVEDEAYWEECRAAIAALPPHVQVRHHGDVPRERLGEVLSAGDAFFLPSRGESYGHAIVEALTTGTPVLISDRTPWRGLEARGVGWDLPVDDVEGFSRVIDALAAMTAEEHARMSDAARAFARQVAADPAPLAQLRALFGAARRTGPGPGARS